MSSLTIIFTKKTCEDSQVFNIHFIFFQEQQTKG